MVATVISSIPTTYRRMATNVVIYAGGGLLVKSVSLFVVPILTRAFTPGGFGAIEVVLAAQAAAATVAALNIDTALGRYFYDYEDEGRRARFVSTLLWTALAASLVTTGVFSLLAPTLSRWLFHSAEHGSVLAVAALGIPPAIVIAFGLAVFRFDRRPAEYAVISFVGSLVQFALMVLAVWGRPARVGDVVLAQVAGQGLTAVMVLARARRYLRLRFDVEALRRSLGFALPQLPSVIISWYIASANRFFLLSLGTLGAVASFAVASKFGALLMAGIQAFSLAWKPAALEMMSRPEARGSYRTTLYWLVGGLSAVALAVAPAARPVLTWYAGPAYGAAAAAASILVLATAVTYGFGLFLGLGLEIAERTAFISVAQVATFVVNTLLNLWLIPPLGPEGAALAVLGASVTQVLVLGIFCERFYGLGYNRLIWLAPGTAGLFIAATRWL